MSPTERRAALALCLLLAAAGSGRAAAPHANPGRPARTAKPPAAAESAPKAESPATVVPETALAELGVSLRDGDNSAAVLSVWPDSESSELGVLPQDRLVYLNAAAAHSRAAAAQAWRAWDRGARLSAVLLRGSRTVPVQSPPLGEEPAFTRGPKELSLVEDLRRTERLEQAAQAAEWSVAHAPPLRVLIPARQSLWIRFPAGIPETVAASDVLEGEVTMAVANDANMDFLCVPPHSKVWGKVVQTSASDGTRSLRIHFFKAALSGGHFVPISARLTDAAGEQPVVRVSPGGTLVVGDSVATDPKKRRRRLLEPAMRLRLELLEPLVITEPPQFYSAGPGFWINTKETETGWVFKVTLLISGRSAEKEGLRVGDIITEIAGRAAGNLDFSSALAAIYGPPGTTVQIVVLKPGAAESEARTLELKRGVRFTDGVESPLPLPFEKPGTDSN